MRRWWGGDPRGRGERGGMSSLWDFHCQGCARLIRQLPRLEAAPGSGAGSLLGPFLPLPSPGQAWSPQAALSVFGFPFTIPPLRSPRLHANIQPLLPLLFSKKEKHCEKRLQRFLGSFQSGEAALGAAVPAHSAGSAPARAVIPGLPHPRAGRRDPSPPGYCRERGSN